MSVNFMKSNKAQSVLEAGILLGIVAMALMAMQIYVKRGVQGSLKKATDADPDGSAANYLQYEPPYAESITDQKGNSSSIVTESSSDYRSFSTRNGTETTLQP